MDSFGRSLDKNKKMIIQILTLLVIIDFCPTEILGPQVDSSLKRAFGPFIDPVKGMMSNTLVRFLLWLALVYSCCVKLDLQMFLIIAVYFVVSGAH